MDKSHTRALHSALLSLFRLSLLLALLSCAAVAQPTASTEPTPCSSCAKWNVPHPPVPVFGNTYYVGTEGLSAVLVTSPEGHVLIDGALPESAPLIVANIETLGFRVEDVRLILNSHAHFDHAGGIAYLQQASGATVAASPPSARVLEAGEPGPDDPQFGLHYAYPGAEDVREIADGDTLGVGPLALAAHFTPGHTAGGTSWTWTSCEGARCLDLVYADSMSPVSADDFLFSRNERYPSVLDDFERSFAVMERLSCDILLAPHPSAVDLWERVARREAGEADALVDRTACIRYAEGARQWLARRLESERR